MNKYVWFRFVLLLNDLCTDLRIPKPFEFIKKLRSVEITLRSFNSCFPILFILRVHIFSSHHFIWLYISPNKPDVWPTPAQRTLRSEFLFVNVCVCVCADESPIAPFNQHQVQIKKSSFIYSPNVTNINQILGRICHIYHWRHHFAFAVLVVLLPKLVVLQANESIRPGSADYRQTTSTTTVSNYNLFLSKFAHYFILFSWFREINVAA